MGQMDGWNWMEIHILYFPPTNLHRVDPSTLLVGSATQVQVFKCIYWRIEIFCGAECLRYGDAFFLLCINGSPPLDLFSSFYRNETVRHRDKRKGTKRPKALQSRQLGSLLMSVIIGVFQDFQTPMREVSILCLRPLSYGTLKLIWGRERGWLVLKGKRSKGRENRGRGNRSGDRLFEWAVKQEGNVPSAINQNHLLVKQHLSTNRRS